LLTHYLKGINPIIILKCENISGYFIDNISMIPRMGNKNEGEVIVEGPSFFIVKSEPIQVNNLVIVEIEYSQMISQVRAYLPIKNIQKDVRFIEDEEFEDISTPLSPYVLLRKNDQILSFEESLRSAYKEDWDNLEELLETFMTYGEDKFKKLILPEKSFGLTKDESLSLYFYTLDFPDKKLNLFTRLNSDLTSNTRGDNVPKMEIFSILSLRCFNKNTYLERKSRSL